MIRSSAIRPASIACLLLALLLAGSALAQSRPAPGWLEVGYGALVDRRQLSHSGEPVGTLLSRLGGRPVPTAGERPDDRLAHSLLDPLVEPYAFVLSDALDAFAGSGPVAWIEVGGLWESGQAQPAWAELLRSRRFVVESDGEGTLRVILPAGGSATNDPAQAARAAYDRAWPVLRFVFAAELRRRADAGAGDRPLTVDVHAYLHDPAGSRFLLGLDGLIEEVSDTRAAGRRKPLDLERIRSFLSEGLQLEGARIDSDGSLRLFGSRVGRPPQILDRPLELADFAVAYRAVARGGLAEPYMSLDRGFSPQTSIVNYGGRLRDTALGLVSLLCDIRFKTFSQGLDVVSGEDLRAGLREKLPEFYTHLERFAAHPQSGGVQAQQTRLWFYPDRVDLTVSPQTDVLVLRRVRMSAASERLNDQMLSAARGEDPPWTRATVDAINRDYDGLAERFSELGDLDQVVRLLSLFTWLRQAAAEGLPVPELDALLALELPTVPTPRSFPQLLTYNALPAVPGEGLVDVFDKVPIGEALDRLGSPTGRPLPPLRRLTRAVSLLDRNDAQHATLLAEISKTDVRRLPAAELDLQAFRAERLRMHHSSLETLRDSEREYLTRRQDGGDRMRVFSVGIGGLDLGMTQVLDRSSSRQLDLGGGFTSLASRRAAPQANAPAPRRVPVEAPVREEWRVPAERVANAPLPPHGAKRSGRNDFGNHRAERSTDKQQLWTWVVLGADGPDERSRKVHFDKQAAVRFERSESGRQLRYRLERSGDIARAVPEPTTASVADPAESILDLPPGLGAIRVRPPAGATPLDDTPKLNIQLIAPSPTGARQFDADVPRALLQRLVLGHDADLTPGRPLGGLAPLPPVMDRASTLMVLQSGRESVAPWDAGAAIGPGEESAATVARALNDWWSGAPDGGRGRRAVVGTDGPRSTARWDAAPRPSSALLLLPDDGFPARLAPLRDRIAAAWGVGSVVSQLGAAVDAEVIVVVSGEAPGVLSGRLRRLAADPRAAGKHLVVWSLSGALRPDLPASLLARHDLAGFGLASSSIVGLRGLEGRVAALSSALAAAAGGVRVEELEAPLLWYF
ncbi:MAG: hypothetical protein GY716_21645 [bacterium]|nr:hypothetical protein [bacterium]